MSAPFHDRIRELNDRLRTTMDVRYGDVKLSRELRRLPLATRLKAIEAVKAYEFSQEDVARDAGSFMVGGADFWFCIRYVCREQPWRGHSCDHSDEEETLRVLRIGYPEELE